MVLPMKISVLWAAGHLVAVVSDAASGDGERWFREQVDTITRELDAERLRSLRDVRTA
jgi:hypothetical protein